MVLRSLGWFLLGVAVGLMLAAAIKVADRREGLEVPPGAHVLFPEHEDEEGVEDGGESGSE